MNLNSLRLLSLEVHVYGSKCEEDEAESRFAAFFRERIASWPKWKKDINLGIGLGGKIENKIIYCNVVMGLKAVIISQCVLPTFCIELPRMGRVICKEALGLCGKVSTSSGGEGGQVSKPYLLCEEACGAAGSAGP